MKSNQGTPVLLRDVAEVVVGAAPKNGATLRNGETVSGMVIMLKGENGKRLIELVKEKIATMHLPAGVKITPFYDQAYVIDGTINTVEKNLLEGFILVTVVLLLFLGNVRAALVTAAVIPLSMLISFIGMRFFGISANLMSLGAIDFGMIVDGAIVMMENSVHRIEEHHGRESPMESVRRAAKEVARPMCFGVAIIIAVYLPILFLEGLEGRMFRPMAITVCAALFGSLLLALTVVPALATFIFRRGIRPRSSATGASGWIEKLNDGYERVLTWAMEHRLFTVSVAVLVLGVAIGSLFFIGTEFMPKLDEGSVLIETRKLPGISLTDSVEISKRVEKVLRAMPEIQDVVIKIGRPDFATEAMGINEGDTYVLPKPKETWTRFHTKEEFIEAMDQELSKIPGISHSFTQPMAMRMDETISGVKADLAIKIFGDDFHTLNGLAEQALRMVSGVPGSANPQMEITSGVAELSVKVDRAALARYGLNVSDVQEAVEAGGSGDVVSEVIDGQKRYTVALRLPDRYRTDPAAIRQISLRAPGGEHLTLGDVARIDVRRGAEIINREEGQRRIVVMSNVLGRDLGSFVAEVRSKLARHAASSGLFHRIRRPVRKSGARDPPINAGDTRRIGDHLYAALHDVYFCTPVRSRVDECSVCTGRRHRRAVAAADESEPLRICRVHRPVRCGRIERRRACQFDKSIAQPGRFSKSSDHGSKAALATCAHDRSRCEPRVYSDGAGHLHRSRGSKASRDRRDRRALQLYDPDVVPDAGALRMGMRQGIHSPRNRVKSGPACRDGRIEQQ